MGYKKTTLFLILICFVFLSGCLFGGARKIGKVRSYSSGSVQTDKGSYQVGPLPKEWSQESVGSYRVISFYHPSYKSNISTNAFCEGSYEDAPLESLTNHLHAGIKNKVVQKQKSMILDHREAFRTIITGTIDGVPVILDTVVIKKNNCLFDFALVSDPLFYKQAAPDFEDFFGHFRFIGDL